MTPDHYFSRNPETESRENEFTILLKGYEFRFITSSSVFSKDAIDKGSLLLIKECILPDKGSVLDIGCGWGAIGIILALANSPLSFTLSDVNQRAISLAKKNTRLNSVQNISQIISSDLFESIDDKFDCILSNPPNSAGKKVCFSLIEGSFAHLNKGGTLQLVSLNKKGAKSLKEYMEKIFGNVTTIGRQSGFHLFLSKKN